MIELDAGQIFEPVQPERRQVPIVRRHEAAFHQGEGIVEIPGARPRDEGAGDEGDEDEDQRKGRGLPQARYTFHVIPAKAGIHVATAGFPLSRE